MTTDVIITGTRGHGPMLPLLDRHLRLAAPGADPGEGLSLLKLAIKRWRFIFHVYCPPPPPSDNPGSTTGRTLEKVFRNPRSTGSRSWICVLQLHFSVFSLGSNRLDIRNSPVRDKFRGTALQKSNLLKELHLNLP